MDIKNFTFNNKQLTDFNCRMCSFSASGDVETSDYPTITFNVVEVAGNDMFRKTSAKYEGALQSSPIQICKDICQTDDENKYFTQQETRAIYKWLDIRDYKKFTIDNELFENVYFIGGFTSIAPVKHAGRIIGFELIFTADRPYGLSDDITETFSLSGSNLIKTIENDSDDLSSVYPKYLKITIKQAGDLTITNSLDDRTFGIKNCENNEVITIDCVNRIIQTSSDTHNVYDDFNYNFFRLMQTETDTENEFTFSLPCDVEMTYNEVRKVGFI